MSEETRRLFALYDSDADGSISPAEFRRLCYDMGYFLSDSEIQMDVKILDLDGSGSITFIKWWKRDDRFKMLQLSSTEMYRLRDIMCEFKKYDADGNGTIDIREFKTLFVALTKKKMLESLKIQLVNKTLMAAMRELDSNHDGKVSFNEFVSWSIKAESVSRLTSKASSKVDINVK
ncbi:Calmodulin [Entophlyctis sp. JEL0112]|nr:Calmodulin [Entophlyctis sp. JEL0112]